MFNAEYLFYIDTSSLCFNFKLLSLYLVIVGRSLSLVAWFISSCMLGPALNGKGTVTRFLESILPLSGSVQGIPQISAFPNYCNVSCVSIQNEFSLVLPPKRSFLGVIKVAT